MTAYENSGGTGSMYQARLDAAREQEAHRHKVPLWQYDMQQCVPNSLVKDILSDNFKGRVDPKGPEAKALIEREERRKEELLRKASNPVLAGQARELLASAFGPASPHAVDPGWSLLGRACELIEQYRGDKEKAIDRLCDEYRNLRE
jgi:hypothetical protein